AESDSEAKKYDKYERLVLIQRYAETTLGAAISPKGYYSIIGNNQRYPVLWDLLQQKKLHVLKDPYSEGVYLYAFSGDSQYVLVGGKDRVSIWHVESGTRYGIFRIADEITAIALNR